MAHCVRIKWLSCCPLELFHFWPFPQQKKKTACCGEVNTSSSWNLLNASSPNLVRSGRNLCGAKICKDKVHWCFADSCLLLIVSGGCHGARSFYWNLATVWQSLPSHEMELRKSQASVVEFLLLADCVLFDCRVPVFSKEKCFSYSSGLTCLARIRVSFPPHNLRQNFRWMCFGGWDVPTPHGADAIRRTGRDRCSGEALELHIS